MAALHNFGPYNVRHNQVVRGSVPVDKPALLIHKDDKTCFSPKVGERRHIGKCFKRYIQARPEALYSINMFEFAGSALSADDICTICNAAMSKRGEKSLRFLMEEDQRKLAKEIGYLQAAGF